MSSHKAILTWTYEHSRRRISPIEQRKEVAADLRAVFNAPSQGEAERLLTAVVKKYAESAPRLSRWLEENVPQGLAVMSFSVAWPRRKLQLQ
jgi:transposase-like protein